MPPSRTCSPSLRSASTAAPGRGSLSPANTPEYNWLIELASRRKWRTTIQPDPTESPAKSATSSTTSTGASRGRPRLRTRDEPIGAQVGYQHRRDPDRAVRLLVVLEQRDDRARKGDPGGIEGVHELGLGPRLPAISDIGAPPTPPDQRCTRLQSQYPRPRAPAVDRESPASREPSPRVASSSHVHRGFPPAGTVAPVPPCRIDALG